jgi:hypothetical protein
MNRVLGHCWRNGGTLRSFAEQGASLPLIKIFRREVRLELPRVVRLVSLVNRWAGRFDRTR